jgi:hypothetical protein
MKEEIMAATVGTRTRGFWAWPGPAYIYELLIAAAIYLPLLYFFNKSWFAMSVITALGICATYISSPWRTDLSAKDWRTFYRYPIWIMRAIALAVGFWLYSSTPSTTGRFISVLVYVVLYVISEYVALRHKRAIEHAE